MTPDALEWGYPPRLRARISLHLPGLPETRGLITGEPFVTPHIAAPLGPECSRMGPFMVDELQRYVEGAPLKYRMTREPAEAMV